jgi:co-chaperonin GroES (HSP10)
MSNTYFDPATDHVLVAELPHETIIDGITMPDNEKQQEMIYGTVVFVGPEARETTHTGDLIAYGPYAGKHIVVSGMQFRLIRNGQIEGYIRKSQ